MGHETEAELKTFSVMEQPANTPGDTSASPSISQMEKQTRTRRLFSGPQLFAFNLVYLGTWYSTGSNMYYALQNGGPAAWFFSYIIVVFGALCQAASFAEMASIQPIAGAQYYWTHVCSTITDAPNAAGKGWITWTSYVSMIASAFNSNTVLLEATIQLEHPDYVNGSWHTTLIVFAGLAFSAFINIHVFRIVPWFELVAGILNICLFFIFLVVLWVMSPRNSPDIFLMSNMSSGWDNYFVSCNVGALSNIFLFISFESVIHMGEETRNPKKAVPQAVFWSVAANGALGLVMIMTIAICMPSVESLLDSTSPLVTVLLNSVGKQGATALVSGLCVMGFSGSAGVVTSVSRLTWAWARDGGLPRYFAHVDAKHRVPVRAVVLNCCIATVLALLNLGNGTYVALGAITSLSSMAAQASYLIILGCIIYARFATGIKLDAWNMGRAGLAINAIALVYTIWVLIFLPFPNNLPVTASNMNYSGPVFGVVLLGSIGWWVLRARNTWEGPNREIVDYIMEQSEQ